MSKIPMNVSSMAFFHGIVVSVWRACCMAGWTAVAVQVSAAMGDRRSKHLLRECGAKVMNMCTLPGQ